MIPLQFRVPLKQSHDSGCLGSKSLQLWLCENNTLGRRGRNIPAGNEGDLMLCPPINSSESLATSNHSNSTDKYIHLKSTQTAKLLEKTVERNCPSSAEGQLETEETVVLPLVSGFIQDVAQWIFKGQPLNTFEKHAPIWKRRTHQHGGDKQQS